MPSCKRSEWDEPRFLTLTDPVLSTHHIRPIWAEPCWRRAGKKSFWSKFIKSFHKHCSHTSFMTYHRCVSAAWTLSDETHERQWRNRRCELFPSCFEPITDDLCMNRRKTDEEREIKCLTPAEVKPVYLAVTRLLPPTPTHTHTRWKTITNKQHCQIFGIYFLEPTPCSGSAPTSFHEGLIYPAVCVSPC